MNILSTEYFSAERQPNGDVWIISRYRPDWPLVGPLKPVDDNVIKITKEQCPAVARLLCPDLIKLSEPDLN